MIMTLAILIMMMVMAIVSSSSSDSSNAHVVQRCILLSGSSSSCRGLTQRVPASVWLCAAPLPFAHFARAPAGIPARGAAPSRLLLLGPLRRDDNSARFAKRASGESRASTRAESYFARNGSPPDKGKSTQISPPVILHRLEAQKPTTQM